MKLKVLQPDDVEKFMEDGYVMVRGAFSRETAARVQEILWREMELNPEKPAEWKHSFIEIKKWLTGDLFAAAYTERLLGAFSDLMGAGRWRDSDRGLGHFTISFPGFDQPPWGAAPGVDWHVDGDHYHHYIHSKDMGMLALFVFTDIKPLGGGVGLIPGSHKKIARILAERPVEGWEVQALIAEYWNRHTLGQPIEVTGDAGDVALCHPFMMHGRSTNLGKAVRSVANVCMVLNDPMNFRRSDGDHSPVEQAILRALD